EFLNSIFPFIRIEEQHALRIGTPVGLGAACQQGVKGERIGKGWDPSTGGDAWLFHDCGRLDGVHHWYFGCVQRFEVTSLGCCSFLFSSLKGFMNSAHIFLSLGRSCSDWRKRSASVAKLLNASTRSNFSVLVACGAGVIAPEAVLSLRSKSRATASTTIDVTTFCWSTNALTRQCSQSRLTTRGMPLA